MGAIQRGALIGIRKKSRRGPMIFSETSRSKIRSSLYSRPLGHISMSWITVIWLMNAGAFLTLGAFAAHLARAWETREKRFKLAANSANFETWEWDLEKDEICVPPIHRAQLGLPDFGRITLEHLMPRWHAED